MEHLDGPAAEQAPRPAWRRALRGAYGMLVGVALVVAVRGQADEIGAAVGALTPAALFAGALAAIGGVGASGGIWVNVLNGLGARARAVDLLRVFYIGQIGKYLPGSVWPILAQMELGADLGIPRRASAAGAALFLWVHGATAALVAAVVLPAAGLAPRWVALLAPFALALLHPRVLGGALDFLGRRVARLRLERTPAGRDLALAGLWGVGMWAGYGLSLALVVGAVAGPVGVPLAAAWAAVGWAIGFAVLFAPAGAGAREATLVALLGAGGLTVAESLTAAVASRLLLTVADAAFAGVSFVGRPRRPVS